MPAMNASGDLVRALVFFVGGTHVLVCALGERRSSRQIPMPTRRLLGLLMVAFAGYVGSLWTTLRFAGWWNAPLSLFDWVYVALMFVAAALMFWAWADAERAKRQTRQPQRFGPSVPTPYTGDSNEDEAHP